MTDVTLMTWAFIAACLVATLQTLALAAARRDAATWRRIAKDPQAHTLALAIGASNELDRCLRVLLAARADRAPRVAAPGAGRDVAARHAVPQVGRTDAARARLAREHSHATRGPGILPDVLVHDAPRLVSVQLHEDPPRA